MYTWSTYAHMELEYIRIHGVRSTQRVPMYTRSTCAYIGYVCTHGVRVHNVYHMSLASCRAVSAT